MKFATLFALVATTQAMDQYDMLKDHEKMEKCDKDMMCPIADQICAMLWGKDLKLEGEDAYRCYNSYDCGMNGEDHSVTCEGAMDNMDDKDMYMNSSIKTAVSLATAAIVAAFTL